MGTMVAFIEMVAGTGESTALARIAAAVGNQATDSQDLVDLITVDLVALQNGLIKGVTSSMLAVDIWALTMLFTAPSERRSSHAYAYPVIGIFAHFVLLLIAVCAVVVSKVYRDMEEERDQVREATPGMQVDLANRKGELQEAMEELEATTSEGFEGKDSRLSVQDVLLTCRIMQLNEEIRGMEEAVAAGLRLLDKKAEEDAEENNGEWDLSASSTSRLFGFCMMGLALVAGWFVRRGVWLHYDSNLVHESLASEQPRTEND